MGTIWGLIIAAVGGLFIVWGRTRSDFVVYRLLVARSRILWGEGDQVHGFYQVSGAIMRSVGRMIHSDAVVATDHGPDGRIEAIEVFWRPG